MNLTPIRCYQHASLTITISPVLYWCRRGQHMIRLDPIAEPQPKAA